MTTLTNPLVFQTLGPGFVKVQYGTSAHQHIMTIPVRYEGTPTVGDVPSVLSKNSTTYTLTAAMATLLDAVKTMFYSDVTFGHYDAWFVNPDTFEPIWIYGYDPLSKVGTAGTATVLQSMATFTFRTGNGGIMKNVFLDTYFNPFVRALAPSYGGNTVAQAWLTYMIGNTSVWYARDDSYAISGMRLSVRYSDVLLKQRGL